MRHPPGRPEPRGLDAPIAHWCGLSQPTWHFLIRGLRSSKTGPTMCWPSWERDDCWRILPERGWPPHALASGVEDVAMRSSLPRLPRHPCHGSPERKPSGIPSSRDHVIAVPSVSSSFPSPDAGRGPAARGPVALQNATGDDVRSAPHGHAPSAKPALSLPLGRARGPEPVEGPKGPPPALATI
jgi:hypothetical protein